MAGVPINRMNSDGLEGISLDDDDEVDDVDTPKSNEQEIQMNDHPVLKDFLNMSSGGSRVVQSQHQ